VDEKDEKDDEINGVKVQDKAAFFAWHKSTKGCTFQAIFQQLQTVQKVQDSDDRNKIIDAMRKRGLLNRPRE